MTKIPSELVMPEPMSGCWLWLGGVNRDGYGSYRSSWAHRASYEEVYGPIPEGLELDHLCQTPSCVNPSHLEPVTKQENIRRRQARVHPDTCEDCYKHRRLRCGKCFECYAKARQEVWPKRVSSAA